MTFTLTEHTADIGIHAEAKDMKSLFEAAAQGLFAIIVEKPREIASEQTVEIRIEGSQPDFLLLDWLSELLMKFELEKLIFNEFEVEVNEQVLTGKAKGELVDLSRHRLLHEVKAITYHGLNVSSTAKGWSADVIVDI